MTDKPFECRSCGQRQWSKPDGGGRHWVQGGHHFALDNDPNNTCRFLFCETCNKVITNHDSGDNTFHFPRDVWAAIDRHLEEEA
jgi:hypothetical protein